MRDAFFACGNSSFNSAAENDAQADASLSDGASIPDASPVTDGRVSPLVCVDGGHTLCDTFDEAELSDIWSVISACAPPFLDSTKSFSPPSSLSTNDVDAEKNCASVYSVVSSSASTKFTASFEVFVDTPDDAGAAPFFAVWLYSTDYPFYEIALTTDATGAVNLLENLTLADGGPAFNVTNFGGASLVQNAWNKVAIEADIGSNSFVDVSTNDGDKISATLEHRPSVGSVGAYRVYLGVPNGGDTKAAAHFDDFTCDVTP